ncbi:hypothetical protein VNO80_17314 [Phaseolus coccineus]|uniref:Trichome birefringence-like N-terminal domain-containing protein n=1 Tax=Phaseolus coccineus TaxID=3886 RepID=A0AAN9MNJ5_PHACN
MVDSPMVSRYRLLTRKDSMRFISSRRAMSFGCFIVVSILFTLLLFLNPSIYQLSPRIRNAFQSSRRYAFSKVFSQIFSNASFAPPPSVPPTANTHHHDKSELSPAAASAPSPCQVSRKVVPRLLPKETLRNWDCSYQSGWHLHLPSEENDRVHAPSPQEASLSASPPSPTASPKEKHWMDEWGGCDVYEGSWVRDDSYPLYNARSCPFIHGSFNCFANGRRDNMYEKYRWQPKNCKVPRLKGNDMLEMLRGKRLVFVGDSLNRNMWESLVCILRNSMEDKSRMFAASDGEEFFPEGSDSIIFKDYNCSVEYYRSPFLVQEWETPDVKGSTKETLRLDLVERSCDKYKDADVLIFNTGHWWTHTKLTEGKSYYQEGNLIHGQMSVEDAFYKAILTWSRWVDTNVDRKKTTVFFRGYSPSHFRDGEWDSGGHCDNETEPMKGESEFTERPPMMDSVELILKKMKTPVFYLNITKMTDFRVDAHPSWFRRENMNEETKKIMHTHQDCSHWCLPGVPDFWNELLYAHLLYNIHRNKDKPPK